MKKILIGALVALTLPLIGKTNPSLPTTPPPLSTVDAQLAEAQRDFQIAKEMFNPWYAGPLLTPSANNVPKGKFVIQPYLFFTSNYARYNGSRKSVNIPNLWTINPVFIFQMGWLSWLDFTVTPQAIYNRQSGQDSFFWGDTSLQWGIPFLKESPYRPAIRFVVGQTLPTGRYDKLNRKKGGIDATGAGAYTTTLSLNISKVFWWFMLHPFNWRLSLNYSFPNALLSVKNFNAYGGGFGTNGYVRPGNKMTIDTSIELSFTQRWVFALDLVYTYQNATKFSGTRGTTPAGGIAAVGAPSNDNLSCAPAIEYNPSANIGFLAGVWFSVIGRNSSEFISGVLTMYYYW
ncbi:MAG: hypothetical protein KDK60_04695 [Chlamydiia bacterium]|nr:hypothetical protein [Chlamydiia bacterium]